MNEQQATELLALLRQTAADMAAIKAMMDRAIELGPPVIRIDSVLAGIRSRLSSVPATWTGVATPSANPESAPQSSGPTDRAAS